MSTAHRGQTVDYSDILRASAALAGYAYADLSAVHFDFFRLFHDGRLRLAWEAHGWPDTLRLERRSFRPSYDETGATTYAAGAEVLDPATLQYFQALQPSTNQPPTVNAVENSAYWALIRTQYAADAYAGTVIYPVGAQVLNLWDGNFYQRITYTGVAEANFTAANWGLLTPFNRYIAWAQAWALPVGEFLAAYDRDPRVTTKTVKLPYTLSADGAQFTLLRHAVAYVWLAYRAPRPVLDGAALDRTLVYTAGQSAFYTATATGKGNFYVAQTTTTAGDTPDSAPAKWSLVAIPYIFGQYLIRAGYADWLTSEGDTDKAGAMEQMAMALLEVEADKLQRQQQQTNRLDWRG